MATATPGGPSAWARPESRCCATTFPTFGFSTTPTSGSCTRSRDEASPGEHFARGTDAMNASYEWLRALVPFKLTPNELRDLLTSRCATVDDLVTLREDLRDVVIGRVVEAKRHPNSDHLWVTKVDAGGEILVDVVCGAANVTVDTLYPFAPVGAVLPGGLKIEKRKIRGETSEGMLCSAKELGLGQDQEGIMALSLVAEPGSRFLDAMPIGDTRLVIDVVPNRPARPWS